MSCNCKCGCDNKYSGGMQCYPLIVKISHQINLAYTCQSYHEDHPSSPIVEVSKTENCTTVNSETRDNGGSRTSTYIFALVAKPGSGCSGGKSSERAAVEFSVQPPTRGWHNNPHKVEDDDRWDDEPPFTKYDSTNPECSVKCKARMRSESDSGEFYFESSSNPNIKSHLGLQTDMLRTLVVEVSDGKVSVEFRRA